MRFLFICSAIIVLALLDLASSVFAQSKSTKVDYGASCVCQFGYGGNACATKIACGIEGGHCTQSCVPPQDNQAIH
jgi:hypothetical protein